MTAHARLAPSAASRWMRCPGSIRLSEGKEDTTSIYSAEGTVAHELLERCLKSGANAVGFLRQTFEADGFTFTVEQEMVDGVQAALDYVNGFAFGRGELWTERRDGLDKIKDLPEPIFGTTDVVWWCADTRDLHIFDLKYGKGVVVEVPDNEQLQVYALTQILRIGERPAKVVLHVMQPRAHHEDGPFRSWETTVEELAVFKKQLVAAAQAVQDPNAPLSPGTWCRFCPAIATCPAQEDLANRVAQDVFGAIEPSRDVSQLPEPADLETERLVFALKHMDIVRGWFTAVEDHARGLLNAGVEVPGFKLVRGKSNRRWRDEEAAEKALTKAGLKKKERTTSKVLSVAQAEKALKKVDRTLDPGLWEKPEGALTIAPEADKRPAVMSAQEVFGALPDSDDNNSNGAD